MIPYAKHHIDHDDIKSVIPNRPAVKPQPKGSPAPPASKKPPKRKKKKK